MAYGAWELALRLTLGLQCSEVAGHALARCNRPTGGLDSGYSSTSSSNLVTGPGPASPDFVLGASHVLDAQCLPDLTG